MLSAVAARKAAALGASQPLQKSPEDVPSSREETPERPKPPQKRKTREGTSRRPKRKKAVQRDPKPRYFTAEDPATQEFGMTIVEDEGEVVDTNDRDEDSSALESDDDPCLPTLAEEYPPLLGNAPLASDDLAFTGDITDSSGEATDAEADAKLIDSQAEKDQPCVLSTFQPVAGINVFRLSSEEAQLLLQSNTDKGASTVLVLSPADTVCLLGTYALTVIHGSVDILGATLNASRNSHRVFAPKCAPLPVLSYSISDNSTSRDSLMPRLPDRVRSRLPSECAVLILRDLKCGVEGLPRVCQTFNSVFGRSQADPSGVLGLAGAFLLSHAERDTVPFLLPLPWKAALSSVSQLGEKDMSDSNALVCLVQGTKKSGKSTFARTLVNHLLTRYQRVAFLECDLGQSEFTPGGIVSLNIVEMPLFGPPFTHPTLPNIAHYVGSTSYRSSPSYYLDAIQSLIQAYRLELQVGTWDDPPVDDLRMHYVIPLVVNTMGWTKGLGADFARRIEDMVQPTDVFRIQDPMQGKDWPSTPSSEAHLSQPRAHVLQPIISPLLASKYTPSDLRNLSILSYFYAMFPPVCVEQRQITAATWNTSLPICAMPPYAVDWTVALDKIILVGAGAEDVVPSEIERVLNGALVALVECDTDGLDDLDLAERTSIPTGRKNIPYTQGSAPPSPMISRCHGLALVRGISPSPSPSSSARMHVLTPLPPSLLGRCRVMVKGELELPVWGMLDYRRPDGILVGLDEGRMPFLQWGKGEGLGTERRKVRRNLMRRSQM